MVRVTKSSKISKILAKFCKFLQIFANFWRARSRLYQNEILQENMRLTAFFKLYKICILLHRSNLNIFAKIWFEKSAIFVKIQQILQIISQNLQKFAKFQKFQLDNLVDLQNAAKRVFSCKNRSRYSRKRATFCRNFANRRSLRPAGRASAASCSRTWPSRRTSRTSRLLGHEKSITSSSF